MPQKRPNDIDRTVGFRLMHRRKMLGKSQGDLADAAGISFQQVQKYEKGVNRISPSKLSVFADQLGITPSYFFKNTEADGLPLSENQKLNVALVQDAAELNRLFPLIPDEGMRRTLIEFVKAVARVKVGS
ncbi:helix-turn-helix domain-containing protein [Nitratireductor luteus]|uniref:helix-turn-helix domain-containing protein n=1 Tax=Nitratireductor luteus TaxID=2976980 RepID=UPI00223ED306|nr:helix-turn-helix domain-containing protein [Nitratireductor luteus]